MSDSHPLARRGGALVSFHTQNGEGGVRSRQVASGADGCIDAAGLGGQLDRFLLASAVDECRRGVLAGRGKLDQPRCVAQLSSRLDQHVGIVLNETTRPMGRRSGAGRCRTPGDLVVLVSDRVSNVDAVVLSAQPDQVGANAAPVDEPAQRRELRPQGKHQLAGGFTGSVRFEQLGLGPE